MDVIAETVELEKLRARVRFLERRELELLDVIERMPCSCEYVGTLGPRVSMLVRRCERCREIGP